ncbi:MAG: Lrp/AsnC family transcriptional regulator [Candidatus Baldrarchaeia archaeon]
MVKAYVMINTRPGKETEIIKEISKMPEVSEVHRVFGPFDIVVEIKSSSMEAIVDLIFEKIRKIDGIEKTITAITAEYEIDVHDMPI